MRTAIRCSLNTAKTMFRDRYADDDWWDARTRECLLRVAGRYEPFNGGKAISDMIEKESDYRRPPALSHARYWPLTVGIMEGYSAIQLKWLTENQWAAVPQQDPIDDMNAEWISEAAQAIGVRSCIGITIGTKGASGMFRGSND